MNRILLFIIMFSAFLFSLNAQSTSTTINYFANQTINSSVGIGGIFIYDLANSYFTLALILIVFGAILIRTRDYYLASLSALILSVVLTALNYTKLNITLLTIFAILIAIESVIKFVFKKENKVVSKSI